MPNPIFFVDGQTEQRVIQSFCKGTPVQVTGLNGKSVSIVAIAKKLAALIKLRGGRNYPIIVIIDREQRLESFEQIAIQLRSALDAEGLQNEDIRIGVADKMFENWILADWLSLTQDQTPPKKMEGRHGTGEIRKVVEKYNKSTDGVRLFKAASQERIYANSNSYRHLVDQLTDIDCLLLNFLHDNLNK
jgi:hypothetical protein